MSKHLGAIFALAILVTIAIACNGGSFTTANISELKFGTNDTAEPSATTFKTGEDIFALATVANVPKGKHKLQWRITYENVPGKEKGEEIGTNSREFEGSSRLWQTFSTPLPGEYKVEATLMDESGKTIESKSGMLTVTRAPSAADDKTSDSDDDK